MLIVIMFLIVQIHYFSIHLYHEIIYFRLIVEWFDNIIDITFEENTKKEASLTCMNYFKLLS